MKHKPDFQKKYKTFDKTAENNIISRVTVNIHTMRDIVRLCIPLMKNSAKDFPWRCLNARAFSIRTPSSP